MEDNFIRDEYVELVSQLEEEIANGYVKEDDNLYVVRQSSPVDYKGNEICPVVDFFFANPVLATKMKTIKVADAKKALFEMLDAIENTEENNDIREAISIQASYLKEYTSNNNKRNDKICHIICVEETEFPMMIYFEEDQVSDNLEVITAGNLLNELKVIVEA